MLIRVLDPPEPLTRVSRDEPIILSRTRAYDLLFAALDRYLRRRLHGRSFLIAGHRGIGKTTVLRHAVHEVERAHRQAGTRKAPLLVPLHGPELLVDPTGESSPAHALKQITLGLYRALAEKTGRDFTELARSELGSYGAETALELRLLLDQAPGQMPLSEFWEAVDGLERGVFHRNPSRQPAQGSAPVSRPGTSATEVSEQPEEKPPKDPDSPSEGRGYREILALASAAQAYRKVIGKLDSQESRSQQSSEAKLVLFDTSWSDLTRALLPLVGVSALGAGAVTGSYPEGVLTAAFALLGTWTLRSSRRDEESQSTAETYTFIRDDSLGTLERELPVLVQRLDDCGLPPVFVIDELDKVDDLDKKMSPLVDRLKHILSEKAFFCFLADREYFDTLRAIYQGPRAQLYPKAHTYFTDRVCISHEPWHLRDYLEELFQVSEREPGDPELEAFCYTLVHEARLHPGDLQHLLAMKMDENRRIDTGRPGKILSRRSYLLSVIYLIAVELELCREEVKEFLERYPETMPSAIDTLYFVYRQWCRVDAAENHILMKQEKDFKNYMLECNRGAQVNFRFWFRSMERLTRALCSFEQLRTEAEERTNIISPSMCELIPLSWEQKGILVPTTSPEELRFTMNIFGRPISTERGEGTGKQQVVTLAFKQLEQIDQALRRRLGLGINQLTDLRFLPASPPWVSANQAVKRMASGGEQEPNPEDMRLATDYLEMFLHHGPNFSRLLALGLTLTKAYGQKLTNLKGIRTVATFLRPSLHRLSILQANLASLEKSIPEPLRAALPLLELSVATGGDRATPDALDKEKVKLLKTWRDRFFVAIEEVRPTTEPDQEAQGKAWDLWNARMKDHLGQAAHLISDVRWQDLVCQFRELEPSISLGSSLGPVTIRAWSQLHHKVVRQQLGNHLEVLWFALPALARLGFSPERIADHYIDLHDRKKEEMTTLEEWIEYLRTTSMADNRPASQPIVLLTSSDESTEPMSTWKPHASYATYWFRPEAGLPDDVQLLVDGHPDPSSCWLVFESDPSQESNEEFEKKLDGFRGKAWKVFGLDPRAEQAHRQEGGYLVLPMTETLDEALESWHRSQGE